MTRPTAAELAAAVDGRVLLLVLGILACVVAVGVILARGNPDAEGRIRDEWREANGPDAPRPWGSDRGAVRVGVLGLAALAVACSALLAACGPDCSGSSGDSQTDINNCYGSD